MNAMPRWRLFKQSGSMRRVGTTLLIVFALAAITSALPAVLPLRSSAFVCNLWVCVICCALAFNIAWVALSLLAIPRAIWRLLRFRGPEAAWQNRCAALAVLLLALLPFALLAAGFIAIRMPDWRALRPIPPLTAEQAKLRDALRADVQVLAGDIGIRNAEYRYRALCAAADYIEAALTNAGWRVRRQGYKIEWLEGLPCYNIEAEIRGAVRPDEIIVVGAHYDSAAMTPAANDNASGVAALLALARAFAGARPERTLRFVAFVNEEAPFFWTPAMGSRVYARDCRARHERIAAMLCLETLGYYTDAPDSQRYPAPIFKLLYPTTGNFVGFIGNRPSGALTRRALKSFRRAALCPSEAAVLPVWVPGVTLSDHWSFWQEGYPAVMVTDTAFFRYRWYHKPEDTPEKLNYERFALAVAGLETVVADLAGCSK